LAKDDAAVADVVDPVAVKKEEIVAPATPEPKQKAP